MQARQVSLLVNVPVASMTLSESVSYLRKFVEDQRKLLEGVTEGPWASVFIKNDPLGTPWDGAKVDGPEHFGAWDDSNDIAGDIDVNENATFIASSRTTLPALVGAIEGMLEKYTDWKNSIEEANLDVELAQPGMASMLISFAESLKGGME